MSQTTRLRQIARAGDDILEAVLWKLCGFESEEGEAGRVVPDSFMGGSEPELTESDNVFEIK